MNSYPLKDCAEFSEDRETGAKVGILVRCPNCGAAGAAYFDQPIGSGTMPEYARVRWQRTGETLETLSLNPSFAMIGHYHSWIRNGQLQVDSEFSCTKA